MATNNMQDLYIFTTRVNSFHYLYGDAEYLRSLIHELDADVDFDLVRLSRSAILLYIFSLEALINRAMDAFIPDRLKKFLLERESDFSTKDKWELLPLIASNEEQNEFDKSSFPWSHFLELIRVRNDYVHPKHDRDAYYKAITSHRFTPLDWKEVPPDSGIEETAIIYRQTKIPKDPYAIRQNHVEKVKRIVDSMIEQLDIYLDGRLSADNWMHSDQFSIVYPDGGSFTDLPLDPNPMGPALPESPSSDIGL